MPHENFKGTKLLHTLHNNYLVPTRDRTGCYISSLSTGYNPDRDKGHASECHLQCLGLNLKKAVIQLERNGKRGNPGNLIS